MYTKESVEDYARNYVEGLGEDWKDCRFIITQELVDLVNSVKEPESILRTWINLVKNVAVSILCKSGRYHLCNAVDRYLYNNPDKLVELLKNSYEVENV